MGLREQIIAEMEAAGETPRPSVVRILERLRVRELNPATEEAQRIRADIAEDEAIKAEALDRWFKGRRYGLPMPKVATLVAEIRAERRTAVTA